MPADTTTRTAKVTQVGPPTKAPTVLRQTGQLSGGDTLNRRHTGQGTIQTTCRWTQAQKFLQELGNAETFTATSEKEDLLRATIRGRTNKGDRTHYVDDNKETLSFLMASLDIGQTPTEKTQKRQNEHYKFEPSPIWRNLLDTAARAASLDRAEEFSDGTGTPRVHDPRESHRTAEDIIEKLSTALGTAGPADQLPFTERTAATLLTYVRTQAPNLSMHHWPFGHCVLIHSGCVLNTTTVVF